MFTTPHAEATALLESKTLSSESNKSRVLVVGKTCIYDNDNEAYGAASDSDCRFFRLHEVDAKGQAVLCYGPHDYWTSRNTRVFSPNFTCSAEELAELLDQHTEAGVFASISGLSSLRRTA